MKYHSLFFFLITLDIVLGLCKEGWSRVGTENSWSFGTDRVHVGRRLLVQRKTVFVRGDGMVELNGRKNEHDTKKNDLPHCL